ncbi:MAG TPA: recombinase family protein [Rhizomicrobium sp.]|jgi:DNA invertase Pin-like site-specific DNA recombinase
MKIGFARTSTVEQIAGYEAQKRDLTDAGCERIFGEQLSSVAAERPQLEAAIEFARDGDVVICTKLDRIARSIIDLWAIVKRLEAKGVKLRILDGAIDTSSANGRLHMNILGSFAQFEREMMLERQREGIAKAKRDGKYKGRKPTARDKSDDVLARRERGEAPADIASALKISPASVYRIIAIADNAAKVA